MKRLLVICAVFGGIGYLMGRLFGKFLAGVTRAVDSMCRIGRH